MTLDEAKKLVLEVFIEEQSQRSLITNLGLLLLKVEREAKYKWEEISK